MCVTKQLLVPTDFDSMKKSPRLVTYILQIIFCVQHKNKNSYSLQNYFGLTEEKTDSGLKPLESE